MLEKIEKPELETVELRSDGKYGKFVLAATGTWLRNHTWQQPAACAALLAARCRSQHP